MKLASLKHGRDGQLLVVSRDLARATDASHVVPTLQAALDDWDAAAPRLQEIADALEAGRIAHLAFDPKKCAAPLPRAFQWADGSAYVNHVELLRKARGAELPASFWRDPLMYQGGSDAFLGPTDPIEVAEEAYGIDFEAEVAVILGDVAMAAGREQAERAIRLLMLVNDVSLRNLIAAELAKGFGFVHSKPASSCSPVAVTPDELGEAWDGSKIHLPLLSHLNGKLFGQPDTGSDMCFDFPTLISHAAKTRQLGAGTIIGSGTVSNYDRARGFSCIVEKRMHEIVEQGSATTQFMRFGDRVRIEMFDKDGHSIFGAIDQTVERYAQADTAKHLPKEC